MKLAVALLVLATPIAFAQSPAPQYKLPDWQIAAGTHAEFDVASIRPVPPDAPPHDGYDLLNNPLLNPYAEDAPPKGLLTASASTVNYIIFAYKIFDVSQMRTLSAQLPAWARTDAYIINARADGSPTRDQIRLMMQSLLADRFHLALHTETRQLAVNALVLEKPSTPGPQLQPHPANVPCSVAADDPPATKSPANATPAPICGLSHWRVNGLMHLRMLNVTMPQIASLLSGAGILLGEMSQRPLIDQTGLTGRFDLNLEFLPERNGPSSSSDSDVAGPTVIAALKSQLGLKLVKQSAPIDTLVVDHIEKPSAN